MLMNCKWVCVKKTVQTLLGHHFLTEYKNEVCKSFVKNMEN